MTNNDLKELSKKIAFITINPSGTALKSAQKGFKEFGLEPKYLIYVSPNDRLKKEFKKYKLSFFKLFLLPKLKQIFKKKKHNKVQSNDILIPNIVKVSKLNSDETVNVINNLGIKFLINCGAGIFKKKIINISDLIILNAHAGRLPNYKNMNVVEWAICNKEKVIGTIHQIDLGIDTGAVWLEEEINISNLKTISKAREIAFDSVLKMFGKAILMYEEGKIIPKKHDILQGKKYYIMHSYYQNKVEKSLNKDIK